MLLRGALSPRLSTNSLTPSTQIVKRFPRIGMSLIAVAVAPALSRSGVIPEPWPTEWFVVVSPRERTPARSRLDRER